LKVTPEDVQRVAKKIFRKEGSSVLDVNPTMKKTAYSNDTTATTIK
jgi:predicted Zn-dependent peptidase